MGAVEASGATPSPARLIKKINYDLSAHAYAARTCITLPSSSVNVHPRALTCTSASCHHLSSQIDVTAFGHGQGI